MSSLLKFRLNFENFDVTMMTSIVFLKFYFQMYSNQKNSLVANRMECSNMFFLKNLAIVKVLNFKKTIFRIRLLRGCTLIRNGRKYKHFSQMFYYNLKLLCFLEDPYLNALKVHVFSNPERKRNVFSKHSIFFF